MPRDTNLPHIFIPDGRTETRGYTYPRRVVSTPPTPPRRIPATHGASLQADLTAIQTTQPQIAQNRAVIGITTRQGMLLEFESEPGFPLALEKIDRKSSGIEVLSVRERGTTTLAAVLVPDGKLQVLVGLIEKYQTTLNARSGKPTNEALFAPIASIRHAALETLWTDDGDLPDANQMLWWEVWLRNTPAALNDFRRLAAARQLRLDDQSITFVDRIVVLVFGSAGQLSASVELLDRVAELRRAKVLASFFMGLSPQDQGEWVHDLLARMQPPPEDAPALCLLDTGVNRGHRLLAPLLALDDLHAVEEAWGKTDHCGHGTLMAGLAAWGDLTVPLAARGPVAPEHVLESVVLLPPAGQPSTDGNLWGAYTLKAISAPELHRPERARVFCMTVTAEDYRDRGRPSSWSAEIDALCEGRRDELPRLMVISSGNVPQTVWHGYPDENDTFQVHDPGQAWNAVTVGAYTEKALLGADAIPTHTVIAPPGALSPCASTSRTWARTWPNKPDVVFEGGNATLTSDGMVDLSDALRLLSTHWQPAARLLDTTGNTSGAAALGARFAATLLARLQRRHGDIWPETLRALMIHSARWTAPMSRLLSSPPGALERDLLLRRYGWGVPDLERASSCASDTLTLVAQRTIQPFHNVGRPGRRPDVKTRDWHLFRLPWPTNTLRDLGNLPVELRVTLSYFIEPSPARRGWNAKRRYQSAGLRFAMIKELESLPQFKARISKNEQDIAQGLPSFSEPGWLLANHRDRGSIHSDIWTGPAIDLAARSHIAVYPVAGWWKERLTADRFNAEMRYTLIISIHTPNADVDIYTPVSLEVSAEVAITT